MAAKLPFLSKQAREALAQGYAPIIGLITTGESHIKGQLDGNAQRVADGEEDDVDIEEISQCRGVMESFLKNHVKDASLDPGFQAIQKHHLKWLDSNGPRLLPNPLDALIEGLGGHTVVAELTGRSIRKKNGLYQKSTTTQETHELERTAFQRGQKKVAVISAAASMGISLHSDRREPTAHKRRMHFVLELAWGADKVMQQLGRSHRTNQQTGPIYKFIVTEQVGADIPFITPWPAGCSRSRPSPRATRGPLTMQLTYASTTCGPATATRPWSVSNASRPKTPSFNARCR